jgi:hypothetical protein
MVQINFDASQVDPSVPFEVLPSDKYLVEITHSEMKVTKAGDGSYLELELTVLDGQTSGFPTLRCRKHGKVRRIPPT